MKFAARWMSMREQRLAKQRVTVSRNDPILTFGEVFETSLTFWDSMNSFSVRFAILLTLCHTYCCTWLTVHISFTIIQLKFVAFFYHYENLQTQFPHNYSINIFHTLLVHYEENLQTQFSHIYLSLNLTFFLLSHGYLASLHYTRKWKRGKKWERPRNTYMYYVHEVRWT